MDPASQTAEPSSTLSKDPHLGYAQCLDMSSIETFVSISFSSGDQHHTLTLSMVQMKKNSS